MDSSLQKVAEMIKKTFHSKTQKDCFDGSVLYLEEHCTIVRTECMKNLEEEFDKIDKKLDIIKNDVKEIKKVTGVDGNS